MLTLNERCYLSREYQKIEFQSRMIQGFMEEIYNRIRSVIHLNQNTRFVDFGCGKGYFLRYLQERGLSNLVGLDPCPELVTQTLSPFVKQGSFLENDLPEKTFDVAFSCHTLHHLVNPLPLRELSEMTRVSRDYVVIVEINNTNLPMFLMSLWNKSVERNASSYNINKVLRLVADTANLRVVFSEHLKSGYISGNSFLHRLAARVGCPPYNLTIAKVVS